MNFLNCRLLDISLRTNLIQKSLVNFLCNQSYNIQEEIQKMVKKNSIVIFMKGTPVAPRCGFSNAVVQILRMHGVEYDAHDVLQSEDLRDGIKEYSNWPTIPQVFIKGEFIGGCDILLQLHKNGNLITELEKAGIKSALAAAASTDSSKKS